MTIFKPPFVDQSEQFKSLATSIEQKHIRRHNEKPGVSRRDENRPSPTFINISNIVLPIATEMYLFRKMLEESTQDYIFATPAYSKMNSEERESFDGDVREKLTQFESFINQLGHRVNSSDGLRNASERTHLIRVHEGLRIYLKDIVDFVSALKKEHLTRLKMKNRSLADDVQPAKKDGHVFEYHHCSDELLNKSTLDFSVKFLDKIRNLKEENPCIQYKPKHKSNSIDQEYDLIAEANVWATDKEVLNNASSIQMATIEQQEGGWDGIDEIEFEDAPKIRPKDNRASPILFNESVRNRRREVTGFDEEQDELRGSYEKWKNEQGDQYVEEFQQQTAILKEQFVKADQDDEIEKLEQHIAEIQGLSAVFSEKVMDQERDIDLINDMALHTSENLVSGNEWIRKATENSRFRSYFLLFAIFMLVLALLFVHWFNP